MKTIDSKRPCSPRLRCFWVIGLLLSGVALAEDYRQLATLPPPAEETVRQEMRGNLLVINEILTLIAAGKLKDAGDVSGAAARQPQRDAEIERHSGLVIGYCDTAMRKTGEAK